MLTRLHKILIGLLAAQLLLAVVMLTRDDESAAAKATPILAKFDAAKVTRVQVAATTGKPLELVKRGDSWTLASHFDYPVDTTKVTDLLSSIAKLSAAGPMASQASRHKQLRVADDQHDRKLTVTIDGKDTTLYIGSSAGSRRHALRLGGDDRVFAVGDLTPWSIGTTARDWVDTAYVRVPREEVVKVAVQRGTQTFELSRGKPTDPWTLAVGGKPVTLATGESLDTGAIDSLVSAVTTIDLSEPGDPKRDAQPTATITIERTSTNTSPVPVVLDVLADGTSYWVRQRGLDRAVLVDKARLETAVSVEQASLVKKQTMTSEATQPAVTTTGAKQSTVDTTGAKQPAGKLTGAKQPAGKLTGAKPAGKTTGAKQPAAKTTGDAKQPAGKTGDAKQPAGKTGDAKQPPIEG